MLPCRVLALLSVFVRRQSSALMSIFSLLSQGELCRLTIEVTESSRRWTCLSLGKTCGGRSSSAQCTGKATLSLVRTRVGWLNNRVIQAWHQVCPTKLSTSNTLFPRVIIHHPKVVRTEGRLRINTIHAHRDRRHPWLGDSVIDQRSLPVEVKRRRIDNSKMRGRCLHALEGGEGR